jgi:hypothetical protein
LTQKKALKLTSLVLHVLCEKSKNLDLFENL